jgi:hypothetical protein
MRAPASFLGATFTRWRQERGEDRAEQRRQEHDRDARLQHDVMVTRHCRSIWRRQPSGRIVKEPFSFPGGRRFHFSDPSGNELAVWSEA